MLVLSLLALLQEGALQVDATPPRPITQLLHTVWTPKQGGGPTGIKSLAQTRDGYLWIGTYYGLVRFDGVRFVNYLPLGGDSIPTETISDLLATRDGSLWMRGGREAGATRLQNGYVTVYGKPEGIDGVLDLAESSTGEVVAGTMYGVFRFSNGRWENLGRPLGFPGKRAYTVFFDHEDGLWVRSETRVLYLPPGGREFAEIASQVSETKLGSQFAEEPDGTVWLADHGHSAYTLRRPGGPVRKITRVNLAPLDLMIDRRGSLWLATAGDGLRRVPRIAQVHGKQIEKLGPEAERFMMKEGGLSDIPTALLQDREGNIWVGSAGGLERFQEAAFAPVVTDGASRPRFLQATRDSSVWTGAYNGTLLERLGPGGHDTLSPGFPMISIAQDRQGRTLVVDGGSRILRLDGGRWTALPLKPGTARALYSLTIDTAGTLWAYSRDLGLLRLVGDSLVQVAELPEPSLGTGLVFSDRRGRIWVGQANRVVMLEGGKLTRFGKQEGIFGFVYGFVEDREGTVWAFTGDGLSRHSGDRFQTLLNQRQVPGGTVYSAAQDDRGYWWLATSPGILQFAPGDIERMLADSTYLPHYRLFDESDGMVGALVKGYWSPILVKADDGRIWVATDSGLAFIDPRKMPRSSAPPVSIEVMRWQGREHAITDGAEIPPGTRDLEIDFTSMTFAASEEIQFRYRLEGADTAWNEVGTRRRAYYTELAPRAYRFVVSASYGDGNWNETAAAWRFRVLPAWYQTLWFKALLGLAIAGLGGTVVAMIQRGRHSRAQQVLKDRYEATLAERARIAQDLHDTLLQGFAGVALQLKTIELALPDQPDVAVETVMRVQRLTRDSLREARARVWEMHGTDLGEDDLPAALGAIAREHAAGSGIEVHLSVHGERRRLTRAQEDVAFRVGREAVVNAMRHADARRLELHFDFAPATLTLEIQDDGRGFTPDEAEDARRKGHFGLSGIRDRARHAGGRCEIQPRAGGGTVVSLELPLK
jgi:signal transduction histidine kinase/ligand-binding sensor domain-containing protein